MINKETHRVTTAKETLTYVVNWLKWQAMAINPFACGYTTNSLEYHDHNCISLTTGPYVKGAVGHVELYSKKEHGNIEDFLSVGDPIPDLPNLFHTHNFNHSGLAGSWEFKVK
ncbi:hypothetical protein AUK04_02575 [Candidatus Roizmanbacteria bacterium CG2_30_33_16]|uniref:Uncharacterized protein n=5 Tax=Candidatus Roizmaniibacteriota TaxID=1752723 RepID=A0A2M7E5J6_9BACT|nr:hypothetical protein [Candidatus Roizmanbacteria bacterium]OIP84157.1 MAG: hypothetical protein AUK04_02575 [Candidatus Roizmanbacteria bacterium CG2_30_33_16]PIP64206.1 MAG: hypothetical protein COW96_03880 [Candidatus Roizmanbacteria bacterium CG22_combo_CG10-13_8_21_14_all_33_16]PIV63007.1 MAG: hypothetical protein COS12_00255 [Candidatus Roizmanbacteria bacterium CG01_land_8_20_14_3_00_33_9]PIX74190.1 MAG: hypothetical protein COZ39_00885 [Candidatus Roizmanbacteria bacterium CG_4_10_14_